MGVPVFFRLLAVETVKQGSGYTKAITVRATSSVLYRPLYQKVICKLRNTLLKYERDIMTMLVHWQNHNDVMSLQVLHTRRVRSRIRITFETYTLADLCTYAEPLFP